MVPAIFWHHRLHIVISRIAWMVPWCIWWFVCVFGWCVWWRSQSIFSSSWRVPFLSARWIRNLSWSWTIHWCSCYFPIIDCKRRWALSSRWLPIEIITGMSSHIIEPCIRPFVVFSAGWIHLSFLLINLSPFFSFSNFVFFFSNKIFFSFCKCTCLFEQLKVNDKWILKSNECFLWLTALICVKWLQKYWKPTRIGNFRLKICHCINRIRRFFSSKIRLHVNHRVC